MFKLLTIVIVIIFANFFCAAARENNVNQLPNGAKFGCLNCHATSSGGALNPFGQAVKKSYYPGHQVNWVPALAKLDSDGDGTTNGQELLDSSGSWKVGFANPGKSDDVTNPGDPSSKPTDVYENNTNKLSGALKINSIYPNPIVNTCVINYELKKSDFISIALFDFNGNKVKNLFDGFINSGLQNFVFDIKILENKYISNGCYMIVIQSGTNTVLEKIVVY